MDIKGCNCIDEVNCEVCSIIKCEKCSADHVLINNECVLLCQIGPISDEQSNCSCENFKCEKGRECTAEGCECAVGEVCSDNLEQNLNCTECVKQCNTSVITNCICGTEICEETCTDNICAAPCPVENCEKCDEADICKTCENGF